MDNSSKLSKSKIEAERLKTLSGKAPNDNSTYGIVSGSNSPVKTPGDLANYTCTSTLGTNTLSTGKAPKHFV